MALITCPECRKKISETASSCPKCGRTLTAAEAAEIKKAEQRLQTGVAIGCITVVVIFVLIIAFSSSSSQKTEPTTPSSRKILGTTGIQYQIVQESPITNGGYLRTIVIDPKHRNFKNMKTLGDTLRKDTASDRNAIVFVYDDARAAAMQRDAANDKLSGADGAFYDQHSIGNYTRNINTGYHTLEIFLDGLNGTVTEINY